MEPQRLREMTGRSSSIDTLTDVQMLSRC